MSRETGTTAEAVELVELSSIPATRLQARLLNPRFPCGRRPRSTRRLGSAPRDYLRKNGFTDAVIGLSGGIDSSLVATIATDALGVR